MALSVAQPEFNEVMLGQTRLKNQIDAAMFGECRATLDTFEFWWPIVTPKEAIESFRPLGRRINETPGDEVPGVSVFRQGGAERKAKHDLITPT
ncbi:hypothetical protein ACQ0MK_12125 [Thalassospira lucentensis]|uniref:hypothetical protein n=1 Tax=Thalassospira lucentensis TaxID=168935 RepID=UPI003D2F14DB